MAHPARQARPDLLDQKEKLEMLEAQELQVVPDLKALLASTVLLEVPDRLANEAPTEHQAHLVDLVSLAQREKPALTEGPVLMGHRELLVEMDSVDHLVQLGPRVNQAPLESLCHQTNLDLPDPLVPQVKMELQASLVD